jgi:hypothetical protein
VVVVGTTRAWELSWESFAANVLDELGADLALCVGDRDRDNRPNPFYERAKFVWEAHEPDDWAEAYDDAVGDSSWRALLRPHDQLFGGIRDTAHPQPGVGALIVYMRRFLKECLEQSDITERYDWLILTRSDFLWPIAHPPLRHLSGRRIYVFDGEHWGGVCGRHLIVPRRLARRLLSAYDPVFDDPERLALRLDRWRWAAEWPVINLERFQAIRLKELRLWRKLRFLPYVPFTVRAPAGPTGWSIGIFDERLGCYVKYPAERERSQITSELIGDQAAWRTYLAPIRGAPARRRVKRAYLARGLHERPVPLREVLGRTYRRARWAWMARGLLRRRAEIPVGRALRCLPGVPALLDARLRRIRTGAMADQGNPRIGPGRTMN